MRCQENRKTVLGTGLGECSSVSSTADDTCAVSAAPVTCTPIRGCSSFCEYGSPQRAVPKYLDYHPPCPVAGEAERCLKASSLCCCALSHMPSGCFLLLEFDPTLWNLLQPSNGYGRLRSGADLSILGVDHKGPCCLRRWKMNKTDWKLVCFLLCTCKQGLW